jgi:phospholipase/carboxylesterase
MSDAPLPTIEIEPEDPADAAVIWLHGLGADGQDFVPAVPHLGLPPAHRTRFVFPTAEAIPVTINAGMVMPAWYDIRDLDLGAEGRSDGEGLRRSVERVRALVAREVERGIAPERIVVAGFSQGGAVAVELVLTHRERLAGLVALSTYLVDPERLEAHRSEANADLTVLQCHGTFDPMVPVSFGEAARDRLQGMGYDVVWRAYPMQHEVCLEELDVIGRYLRTQLAAPEAA